MRIDDVRIAIISLVHPDRSEQHNANGMGSGLPAMCGRGDARAENRCTGLSLGGVRREVFFEEKFKSRFFNLAITAEYTLEGFGSSRPAAFPL